MVKALVYMKYCFHQLKKEDAYPMDIVKVIYREGKPFKLRMKSILNHALKSLSFKIIVFEMDGSIEEDWNETHSDPVLIETITEQ